MMAITVFSLKPARTSLMTAALVSGSLRCWAKIGPADASMHKTKVIMIPEEKAFISRMAAINVGGTLSISDSRGHVWRSASDYRRLCAMITIADAPHIVARFPVWRNFVAILDHGSFAGIITCQHQIHPAVEAIGQLLQITGPG